MNVRWESRMIIQVTPNLFADRIEPSIDFFKKVGFNLDVEVPEDDHIGFAILVNGPNQVMYQTRQSLRDDSEAFLPAADGTSPSLLFITVSDVEGVAQALEGYEIIMKMRDTFYGAKEISFLEPAGHVVTFAEFADRPAD